MVDLTPLNGVPAVIYAEITSFVTTNATFIGAAFGFAVILLLGRKGLNALRAKM